MTLPDWPRAWGEPPVSATLRASPADFEVEEDLGFEPGGGGEHCWLWIEKENLNTVDAAQRLARFAGLRERDISYAGLKDKQALTRQWFSLHVLNREIDWAAWQDPALRILRTVRHSRKLRRGAHRGNRFRLVLREVSGDLGALRERQTLIAAQGVPNYFGEQRFGRDGRNIDAARAWFAKGCPRISRNQSSLYFSSIRALLFNAVLAGRVERGSWCSPLAGDVFALNGSNSVFREDEGGEALVARVRGGDVHPTGPLPGRAAGLACAAAAAELEALALAPHAELIDALAAAGVEAARRSLRVLPSDWRCEPLDAGGGADWLLVFRLPRGCFATSLVRELARISPLPQTITRSQE